MITKLHDKNKILDKYIEIIKQNNFKSSDILVFVDNNINRLEYIKKIELKISEELKICTYSQFVRGEIITYWPIILNDCEDIIKKNLTPTFISSNLKTYIFEKKVEMKRNKENYFDDITGTNKSIASNIMNNLDNAIYNQIDYKKIGKIEGDIERISFLIEEHKKTKGNLHLIILDMQEKERGRIARELHDSSIQNLTHLIHGLELSSLYIDKDPIQAKLELESCSQTLKKAIDEIRDTVFDLRPMSFDDLGFNQCIENLIDSLKTQNPEFTFISDVDIFDTKVEKDQKNYQLFLVSVYRIVHEALLNAVKHSKGSKVELSIKKTDDHLIIKVIDNGKGFIKEDGCPADKHFGISVMQERVFL